MPIQTEERLWIKVIFSRHLVSPGNSVLSMSLKWTNVNEDPEWFWNKEVFPTAFPLFEKATFSAMLNCLER